MSSKQIKDVDDFNLVLLRKTGGGLPYHPATYTCVTEFTPTYPSVNNGVFKPEPPYPVVKNDSYLRRKYVKRQI